MRFINRFRSHLQRHYSYDWLGGPESGDVSPRGVVVRSRRHPIWLVYAAAGRRAAAHICMDAGEFRLSPSGRWRCVGRDSGVVTGARWRSITQRTNDYRRLRFSADTVAVFHLPAVRLPLLVSLGRISNQNFLALRRTPSASCPLRCRSATLSNPGDVSCPEIS